MVLGLSKDFVLFLFLSTGLGLIFKNFYVGLIFFGSYCVIKIVWNFLTK